MVNEGFSQYFLQNMDSDVHIEYRKEAGICGKTTVRMEGYGAMLFDAVCEILKALALEEAKQEGAPSERAVEYVDMVHRTVCSDIKGEG